MLGRTFLSFLILNYWVNNNIVCPIQAEEQHLAKIKQQLEEELQTKDQQVKQYKKQVDSYKAELEKCQNDLQTARQVNLKITCRQYPQTTNS